jgi:FtsP/CotA-like multicopper oxidase with cupredoxin domain
MRYCYIDADGRQSPTLRVHPGDRVTLKLKNELAMSVAPAHSHATTASSQCGPGRMTAQSTNFHFHGLSIPPVCHQDESLNTAIQPADTAFEYEFRIPKNQTPGLYWYHPHVHGDSEAQVLGGASGALIVEGLEQPLPERVLVIRDQNPIMPSTETGHPAKDLSINFVPVPYPDYPMAIIRTKPTRREFWRVLNACADTYLDLGVLIKGKWTTLGLVAVDGAPFGSGKGHEDGIIWKSDVAIPPGGRAEFIVQTPAEHVEAELINLGVDTSPLTDEDDPRAAVTARRLMAPQDDDANPPRQLAKILASAEGSDADALIAPVGPSHPALGLALARAKPVRQREFYFSEEVIDPLHPNSSTVFYITEKGHQPKAFDPTAAPDVTVRSGDVEDWVIENRSQESHAFHIHQLRFLTLERDSKIADEQYLRDTVDVSYWDGISSRFPSVKLRMDFRDPAIVGRFPYHCHVLQHADGGMMGVVEVKPRLQAARQKTSATAGVPESGVPGSGIPAH